MSNDQVVSRVRQAIDAEPRIRSAAPAIGLGITSDGSLTIEGEVATVAAKKLAVDRAAQLPDVVTIVDRLRVAPQRRFSDEQIRRRLLDLLSDEPVFRGYEIGGFVCGRAELDQAPAERGRLGIEFTVDDGVVTLDGTVGSLEHQRLAGVLAWWVPGSRDVVNALAVDPPEEDNDMEIAEAVRLALEKDPIVDAARVNVVVHEGVAHLAGAVAADEERRAAESDAWYVLGVRDVLNEIAVPA